MLDLHLGNVGQFQPMAYDPTHDHTTNGIVGYAVRETVADNEMIEAPDGRIGRDVAVISGAENYIKTFPIRDRCREQPGGYAVVDRLYACGCRSRG